MYHVSFCWCVLLNFLVNKPLLKSVLWLKCSYHPIPVVFSQAKGSTIWDPEGKRYLDFLSAYSAVNQVIKKDRLISVILMPYLKCLDLTARHSLWYSSLPKTVPSVERCPKTFMAAKCCLLYEIHCTCFNTLQVVLVTTPK